MIKRPFSLIVKMTLQEMENLKRKATKRGQTLSVYIRELLKKTKNGTGKGG